MLPLPKDVKNDLALALGAAAHYSLCEPRGSRAKLRTQEIKMPYVMGLEDVVRLNFGFPAVPGQGAFTKRLYDACQPLMCDEEPPKERSIYDDVNFVLPDLAEHVKRIDPCDKWIGKMALIYTPEVERLTVIAGAADLDFTEALIRESVRKFGAPKVVGFRWGFGPYSGGASIITQDKVRRLEADEWLAEQLELADPDYFERSPFGNE
jgi:hypothetical protein